MEQYQITFAKPQDAKKIFFLFYTSFISKFQAMLPENPENGIYLYYSYFYKGLQKKKDKIVLLKDQEGIVRGFLALEGLGAPFVSGNPGLTTVGRTITLLGFKKFLRLFIGMLLIEGYPPSTDLLYINTIIIDSKYQRIGLGRKLIRVAEKIAKKRNFKGICLFVDIDNHQALNFYKKLEFHPDSGFGGDFVKKIIGVKYYSYQYKLLSDQKSD